MAAEHKINKDDVEEVNQLSSGLYGETEKPGQPFPLETHMIIRDRYDMAADLALGKRVLEVGCGAGMGLNYLAKSAESLHAIEYSGENIFALSRQDTKLVTLEQADAHFLPYKDGSFELVVALAMVYYLSLRDFLKEVHRVLAEDGVLFFCTSNKDVPGFCSAPFTTRYYSIPELAAILEAAGFEVEFHGVFPSQGAGWLRRLRAVVKGILKSLVGVIPGGRELWRNLRDASLGVKEPLPASVEEMPVYPNIRPRLPTDSRDFEYRVIYVTAKKRSI